MKRKKVMIFGAKGFLGTHFRNIYPEAFTPDTDIADYNAVNAVIDEWKPDIVINAAGKTGRPNVDWCELHQQETMASNVVGPIFLSDACEKRRLQFIHIGSGCIYSGDENEEFTENVAPNFYGSTYSRSKIASEEYLKGRPALVLRLRMPFDDTLNERTLIGKLVKYKKVLDVKNSLTYIPDFVAAAQHLIEQERVGIYNVVNPGCVSPYEVMQMYAKAVDPSHQFGKLTIEELAEVVTTGRSNCVLSTYKLRAEGIILPSVRHRLELSMERIALQRAKLA